jgi:hypothetical protein
MLKEDTSLREERAPQNSWKVNVYTSNIKNAGTGKKKNHLNRDLIYFLKI